MNNYSERTKFLMSYNNKKTLNENFKMMEESTLPVITDWLSPDEKFIIFFDDLYDLENKTKIGNIWENFDHLKFFLKHSFEVAKDIPQQIRESVLNSLSNSLLIESKTNYSSLKPLFRQFLTERTWGEWAYETGKDFGKWAYEKGEETIKGLSDFATTSFKGAQQLLGNISRGEWNEVIGLLKKGALYVARRLRDAMFHPVGMVLDIILVASGIGKGAQALAWAMIVALDIYEITTGDTEEKIEPWLQYLYLGIDILGFLTAGGFAAMFRGLFKGVRTIDDAALLISRNPSARQGINQMIEGSSKVPGLLSRAAESLSQRFPGGATFIKGILGSVEYIISKMVNVLKSLLSPKPIIAGTTAAGVVYGAEKGMENLGTYLGSGSESDETQDGEDYSDLMSGEAEYKF